MRRICLVILSLLAVPALQTAAADPPPRKGPDAVAVLTAALQINTDIAPQRRQSHPPGVQLAQEVTCPSPGEHELYCGIYDNSCLYCADTQPFICVAQGMCFERQEDAQAVCGWDFSICGAPVQ